MRNIVHAIFCIVAMFVASGRFHAAFVTVALIDQTAWILRQVEVLP